jgi:hypothetical protein
MHVHAVDVCLLYHLGWYAKRVADTAHPPTDTAMAPKSAAAASDLISHEAVTALEAQLDNGASIQALRRFDRNLRALTLDNWGA